MSDPRHLHEYDADDTIYHPPTIRNTREVVNFIMTSEEDYATLNERITALEAALRGMVAIRNPEDGGWNWYDYDDGDSDFRCNYCIASGEVPDTIRHEPECPVLLAKALLGEDGHG